MTRSYAALTTLVLGAGLLVAPAPVDAVGATPAGYEANEATLTWSRVLREPEAAADVQVDVARFGWARSQDVVVGTTRGPVAGRPNAGGARLLGPGPHRRGRAGPHGRDRHRG